LWGATIAVMTDIMELESTVEPVPRKRSKLDTALTVVAVILTLSAVVLLALGWHWFSDASDARGRADALDGNHHALVADEVGAHSARDDIVVAADKVRPTLESLMNALDAEAEAQRHEADIANHAVDQYNNGDSAGAAATFANDAAAAISDVEQKTNAVHTALADAQAAVKKLREVLDAG
jgi:hypothetical protein